MIEGRELRTIVDEPISAGTRASPSDRCAGGNAADERTLAIPSGRPRGVNHRERGTVVDEPSPFRVSDDIAAGDTGDNGYVPARHVRVFNVWPS
jgi:hypothetical protein